MDKILKKFGIEFDEKGNTLISKSELEYLLSKAKLGDIYYDESRPSNDEYLLIENNSNDFYTFPLDELEEWEQDGSCGPGDKLFKITLIKSY